MFKPKLFALGAVFCLCLHSSRSAVADDIYGRIRGTVTDPTGAVIIGAQITAINLQTGTSKQVTSGADGNYEFLQLAAPGTYRVSAQQTGFKAFEAQNIQLGLNQVYVLNIKLELGAVTQLISVEAAPAQVETTSMQLGRTLTSTQIVNLPLNGRNWIFLEQTLPGVVGGSDRFGPGGNFAVNGNRTQSSDYLVNGTDANDLPLNAPQVILSPDAIGEVNLITNTINPEYGRNGGAILNATTKSGTNGFHGDAFDFYRDTGLNTRNFFSTNKTIFHQHQFGGTIGGPIKKDKAFFFFSYQGTRTRQPESTTDCGTCTPGSSTVFTPAERTGNFSADGPFTGTSAFPLVGENGTTFPAGTSYSAIFPTGHIPTVDLNTVAVNLTNKYVPLPNAGTNLYEFNPVRKQSLNQYVSRVDANVRSKDSIFGYWFIEPNARQVTTPFYGGDLPGFGQTSYARTQQYTLSWTHTFGPTTVNEARFGYQRLYYLAVRPANPILPSAVGFTGINPQNATQAGVPYISVTGLFALGFSQFGPQPRVDQTYQVTDNLSKVTGRHTLKFGFQMRRSQVYNPFFSDNNGNFTFGGAGTYTTGLPGADFLLGIPDSYVQSNGGVINARTQTYYTYAQDQLKLRPNLTLTYGVGWQVDTPITDLFNGGVAINALRPGVQSKVFPTAPTGLLYPGDPGINSAGYNTKWAHFSPRFGFAWSPGSSGKTSVRGGFGIYFNRTEEELTLQNLTDPPFSVTSTGIGDALGSPAFATPYTDISTGRSIPNKFPFSPPKPGTPIDFSSLFGPLTLNVFDPNMSVPYSENYNLTIEHELPGAAILSIAYVGSAGHKLSGAYEANPAGSEAGNPICVATPGCNAVNNYFKAPQAFRFPQTYSSGLSEGSLIFASISYQGTFLDSNYNSLQVTLDKKPTHGLSLRATYTYSHGLDDGSSFEDLSNNGVRGIDPFNFRNDYGDSSYDARHRFVASYMYEIPSLRRLNAFRRLPSRLTDGWRIVGITTFQAGFPVTVGDQGFRSYTCDPSFEFVVIANCWDRPNVVKPVATFDPRTSNINNSLNGTRPARGPQNHYWFDPNAFAREPLGTLGNAGRNFFHGPGINNFDFALHKDTRITESTTLELRFESFNVFNHTQFTTTSGVSEGNSNSANFGRILTARPPGIDSRILQLAAKFIF